jgi:asparagine synthase (glutamine-hydrolysing)
MLSGVARHRANPCEEATDLEFSNYLPFTLLRDTDVMSMAHAVEVRVPFLDTALVEYVLSLPLSVRFGRDLQKPLLAEAVPEAEPMGRSPKRGFTLPFVSWLRGPLNAEVRERLSTLKYAGAWVKKEEATRLFEEFLLKEPRLWSRVWAVYVLDCWLEGLARKATE